MILQKLTFMTFVYDKCDIYKYNNHHGAFNTIFQQYILRTQNEQYIVTMIL